MISTIMKNLNETIPAPLFLLIRFFYRILIKPVYMRAYIPRKIINFKHALYTFKRSRSSNDINLWEKKVYSQNGEDGLIEYIFDAIGVTNRYYVEFGTQDGSECNTKYLRKFKSWKGLLMDGDKRFQSNSINLHTEFITAENIEQLLDKYNVPIEFDLLSIDIDGNDYWVWKAIKKYHPRLVVIEYNAAIPISESLTIKYSPSHMWDGTNYMGASLLALNKLGKHKGYKLLACDNIGVNAFFIREDLANNFKIREYHEIYKKPAYGTIFRRGHPKSGRKMITV
jgi:hypothetical protein